MNKVTEPKLLERYESKSRPGTFNEIRLGSDGAVYCTCWAWKINKWCKHLDCYHGKTAPSPMPAAKFSAVDSEITKEIDDVIKSIGGGVWPTD